MRSLVVVLLVLRLLFATAFALEGHQHRLGWRPDRLKPDVDVTPIRLRL